VRDCRAEVGEEGFFLGGVLVVVVEVLGEGWRVLGLGQSGRLALGEGRRFWGVLEALLLWWMIDGGSL
jgi:hypothetical protein